MKSPKCFNISKIIFNHFGKYLTQTQKVSYEKHFLKLSNVLLTTYIYANFKHLSLNKTLLYNLMRNFESQVFIYRYLFYSFNNNVTEISLKIPNKIW